MERQHDRDMDRQQADAEAEPGSASGDPGRTRRSLLARAAGGFALAASGLYLPDGHDEAEAKGPSGRLGNRTRSRKRKRRNRRRNNRHGNSRDNNNNDNDRKNKGNNGKGAPEARLGIRFTLYNATLDGDFGVEFFAWRGEQNTEYELVNTADLEVYPWSNHNTVTFEDDAVEAFLWIADRYYVNAYNPNVVDMWGGLGLGGQVDSHGNWNDGAIKVRTESFFPGQHLRFRDDQDGYALDIVLERQADAHDHKSFVLWIGDGQGPFDPAAEAAPA